MVFFFFYTHFFFFLHRLPWNERNIWNFYSKNKERNCSLEANPYLPIVPTFCDIARCITEFFRRPRAIKVGTCQHNRMSTKAGHFCIVKCSNGRSNPAIKGNSNGLGTIGRVTFAQESISTAQTQMKIFDISVNRGTSIYVFMMLRAFWIDRNKFLNWFFILFLFCCCFVF